MTTTPPRSITEAKRAAKPLNKASKAARDALRADPTDRAEACRKATEARKAERAARREAERAARVEREAQARAAQAEHDAERAETEQEVRGKPDTLILDRETVLAIDDASEGVRS